MPLDLSETKPWLWLQWGISIGRNTHMTSHTVLRYSLLALLGLSATSWAQTPTQLAPQQQIPGVYKAQIGQTRVIALFDGVVALKRSELAQITPEQVQNSLTGRYVPENKDGLQTAVNAFLIDTGREQVLVDTGTANCFPGDLGHVAENLRYAGYRTEDIDAVVLTHGHPDHMCGLLSTDGKPIYANAQVWLDKAELQYWQSPKNKRLAPKKFAFLFDLANKSLQPYLQSQRVHTFSAGTTLPAGLQVLPTPGHTIGHSAFVLPSKNERDNLMLWGDVVHYHSVQLQHPEATYEIDQDYAQSVVSRRKVLQQTAARGWWVAGAHMPFPGLGHVRPQGQGYEWVASEFSPLPASAALPQP